MSHRLVPLTRSARLWRPTGIFVAAALLPLAGCATGSAFSECDTYAAPPAPCDPYGLNSPTWGGVSNVFGTPAWSPQSVFGTPAYGMPPSVYGQRLHVPPGESAAARVLALTEQLNTSKSENEQLANRIRGLEADVETGSKALAQANREVSETRNELANTRADLEQWKQEMATMREKLDAADKDNLSTLQTTVGLLQQLMANEHPPAEGE